MTGFSETGDHALGESSRYLQASGGRRNFGIKPARYHFVIRAILKHEKSLKIWIFLMGGVIPTRQGWLIFKQISLEICLFNSVLSSSWRTFFIIAQFSVSG